MNTRKTTTRTATVRPLLTPLCENGCDRPAVSWDHLLCAPCDADMAARYFVGDDEGELLSRGITTRDACND